ncbi:MAG: tRNA (cytidine(56)-2'-O)-methyltransferase [Candidatus Diapherotrites archaeon]|nr:tRNA (cytidine(56)-2'-O)-methyltransferase [Candidatus Diapherotrites archaeon]
MKKELIVFRHGHRIVRDYRVTSHCCLVARALGANRIIICGARDESVERSVADVNKRWGGQFGIEFIEDWKKELKELKKKKFKLVHLTMYGLPVQKVGKKLQKLGKIVAIIGSQKVEREIYELADFNVSVTQQPHSEIAALAVFLDRLQNGKELAKKFGGAKIRVVPSKKGKNVVNLK